MGRRRIIIITILLLCNICYAYEDDEICDAIYYAEGGEGYGYGIKSVPYEDEQEARRICINTVRNNRRRFAEYGHKKYSTYLEFLASRYAPIEADNDPKGLNRYWLGNVIWFLEHGVKNEKKPN